MTALQDGSAALARAPEQEITVAGVNTTGKAARVTLRVGDWIFEAPVWFCDPWPGDFGLLGINGFWRYFEVRVDPDQEVTECEPREGTGVVLSTLDVGGPDDAE